MQGADIHTIGTKQQNLQAKPLNCFILWLNQSRFISFTTYPHFVRACTSAAAHRAGSASSTRQRRAAVTPWALLCEHNAL